MAQSPSHKFGQIIGGILEKALEKPLRDIARKQGLFLDTNHPRPARNGKNRVSWKDARGNVHDLDFVFERSGSEEALGSPCAFIECAWRRYTKHSRNKAQEIQGAIGPLAETYSDFHPFLGVVLAGVFTRGSIEQLQSNGFEVLYYPFESIVRAFSKVGIDAYFNEETSDTTLRLKVERCEKLPAKDMNRIVTAVRAAERNKRLHFLQSLENSLTRQVKSIRIVPLFGNPITVHSITEAVSLIERMSVSTPIGSFLRYEVNAIYTNGDEVRGEFHDKWDAIRFLQMLK